MLKELLVFGVILLLICGCGSNRIDEDEAAKEVVNQIFEYLNNSDTEGLKTLFSKDVSNRYDLDKEIEGLYEFLEGKIITYGEFSSGAGREQVDYGKQTLLTISPVIRDVRTDSGNLYEIRVAIILINEDEEDKVGIDGLKIMAEDGTEYLVGDW